MNNVSLSGNITRDLELKTTPSGKKVLSFSIAINEGKDKTEFINLVAWEKSAELIHQYCQKGDRLACTGRIQTRSWDKDGEKRYATEVVINTYDFPPKRAESGVNQPQTAAPVDELEDEIPFVFILPLALSLLTLFNAGGVA